jgi:hypothetical protein
MRFVLRALDGVDAGLSGVMLLIGRPHLGRRCILLLSGLLFFGGRPLEGRDPQAGAHAGERRAPVFGGYEVGIGFSGTCTTDSGELEASRSPASAACGWRPRSS